MSTGQDQVTPAKSTPLGQDITAKSTVLRQDILEESTVMGKYIPEKSTLQEQSMPQKAMALKQRITLKSAVHDQVISKTYSALEQYRPPKPTVHEQDIPKKSTIKEKYIPEKSTVLGKYIPEKSTFKEQNMRQKSAAPEQETPSKLTVQEQLIPTKSTVLEQDRPPKPMVQEKYTPTKATVLGQDKPTLSTVQAPDMPLMSTGIEQKTQSKQTVQEQDILTQSTAQGQDIQSKQTVLVQDVPKMSTGQDQVTPAKSTTLGQDITAKSSVLGQDLPVKSSVLGTHIPDKSTVLGHDIPTKSMIQKKYIPEKSKVLGKYIPEKSTFHEQNIRQKSMAPEQKTTSKPTVQEQVIPTKSMVLEQDRPTKPTVQEKDIPTKSKVLGQDKSTLSTVPEPDMSSKPTALEQKTQSKPMVQEQDIATQSTAHGQDIPPKQTVLVQDIPKKSTGQDQVTPTKSTLLGQDITAKSTVLGQDLPEKSTVMGKYILEKSTLQEQIMPPKAMALKQKITLKSAVHDQVISKTYSVLEQDRPPKPTVHEQDIPKKSPILGRDNPTKSTVLGQFISTKSTAMEPDVTSNSTILGQDYIPAKSTVLGQDISKTSTILGQDKQERSIVCGQDIPEKSILLGQDKPAKSTEQKQDANLYRTRQRSWKKINHSQLYWGKIYRLRKRDQNKRLNAIKNKDFGYLTRMLQEQGIESRPTVRGQRPKPVNISSSGSFGHQAESQGSITPPQFTAQEPIPNANALDEHTTEIDGSATQSTYEKQQEFFCKSVETMTELCRCNGERFMAQIEDVKRMMKENDNTPHEQEIKEFICQAVGTMNEMCRTNEEKYITQIEDVKQMMKENGNKQNESNIKFQRDKDKRHILSQLNGVLQKRIRNLQTMKDDFLITFGQLGTQSDRESLKRLLEIDEQLQRRQDGLEETLSVEWSTKETMADQVSVTTDRGSCGKKSLSFGQAVKAKILELNKKIEDRACVSEQCLVKELDEVQEQLRKKTEEAAQLKRQIRHCKPEEKKHLQKRLEQNQKEVKALKKINKVLEIKNENLQQAMALMKAGYSQRGKENELSNLLKPIAEKDVELEIKWGGLKEQLKYIETESCLLDPCSEPSSVEDDAESGNMDPEPLKDGRAIKQWIDNMESFMRMRLKNSESEVEILQKYRGDMRKMIYLWRSIKTDKTRMNKELEICFQNMLQMIVGIQKDDSESRAYGRVNRDSLEQIVEKFVEISSNVQEELSILDRECSPALNRSETNKSVEEAIGNNGDDLKSIERAVQTWSEAMSLMFVRMLYSSAGVFTQDFRTYQKYQNAAANLMLILNGHFQTIAGLPTVIDNQLKTLHIFNIMQDSFARQIHEFSHIFQEIIYNWGLPKGQGLHVIETERKRCENRLADCKHTFGGRWWLHIRNLINSTYYTHVAAEIASRMAILDQYNEH
ncbi:uncharacterized protein LOC127851780 isoform X2 [Dreissena polymorpha]|uniref:uncharacterized protein LOC127851780 isoform X2 n=1 Tax=Dreissena polymorpha TaxID=45954 RepID=UPI002264C717|nr:uncharacterized protein LOC127851780 isoform X2 [Dreissena polymorpha]